MTADRSISLSSRSSSAALNSIATDDEDIEAQAAKSRQLGKVKRFTFEDAHHGEMTLARLDTMRRAGDLCDVMIEIDGHSVAGHSVVLSSLSVYLFDLFCGGRVGEDCGGLKGGVAVGGGVRRHFKLDGLVDYRSFEILVNYAYTSRLECEADEVSNVLRAAQVLKISRVVEECANFLPDNLTPRNCIGICSSVGHIDLELRFRIHSYIQANLQDVIEESQEFRRLPSLLIDIIGVEPKGLNTGGEKSLCKLVVDWLGAAVEERSLEQLAEDTHILYLSSDNNLRDCLDDVDDSSLNNSDVVRDYKKLAKRKQMMPVHKTSKDKASGFRMRRSPTPGSLNGSMHALNGHSSTESLLSLVGAEAVVIAAKSVGDKSFLCIASVAEQLVGISIKFRAPPPTSDNSSHVTPINMSNGARQMHTLLNSDIGSPESEPGELQLMSSSDKQCSLEPLAPMSSPRCGLGTAVIDGNLVALGGYDRGECHSTVESYSLETNNWSPLKPMLKSRGRFSVAKIEGQAVYACGGSNGQADLNSVERYDLKAGSWSSVADMHYRRTCAGVAVCRGRLYVVGGWSGVGGRTTCEVYDEQLNQWNIIAELNIGRSQVALCEVDAGNGAWLMAAGGCDAWNCTPTVERYDPSADRWSFVEPMYAARRGASSAYFKNKVYVVGGSDGQQSLMTVEIFDPTIEQWTAGRCLTVPRANLSVSVVDGRLWAVGGFSGKQFLDTIEYLGGDGWCAYLPQTPSSNSGSPPPGAVISSGAVWVSNNCNHTEERMMKEGTELQSNGWNSVPGEVNGYNVVNGFNEVNGCNMDRGCTELNGHNKVDGCNEVNECNEVNGYVNFSKYNEVNECNAVNECNTKKPGIEGNQESSTENVMLKCSAGALHPWRELKEVEEGGEDILIEGEVEAAEPQVGLVSHPTIESHFRCISDDDTDVDSISTNEDH